MKALFISSLFLLSTLFLNAQDKDDMKNKLQEQQLPKEVPAAFHKDFPTATNELWEKEGGLYEVNFNIDRNKMSASYTKAGYRKEIEREIDESKLPSGVHEYILKNYPGYKLKTVTKIVTDKAVTTFETEITKDNKSLDLIFDTEGKFKKKGKAD